MLLCSHYSLVCLCLQFPTDLQKHGHVSAPELYEPTIFFTSKMVETWEKKVEKTGTYYPVQIEKVALSAVNIFGLLQYKKISSCRIQHLTGSYGLQKDTHNVVTLPYELFAQYITVEL